MAHSYAASYPKDMAVSEDAVRFFEDFYRLSDTPGADDQYVRQFTPDATFVLGAKTSQGADSITVRRRAMWESVVSRTHTLHQIYPFGGNSLEFMLRGAVVYELKNGGKADVEWAGFAKLVQSDGRLKFAFYQVFLAA